MLSIAITLTLHVVYKKRIEIMKNRLINCGNIILKFVNVNRILIKSALILSSFTNFESKSILDLLMNILLTIEVLDFSDSLLQKS